MTTSQIDLAALRGACETHLPGDPGYDAVRLGRRTARRRGAAPALGS